MIEIQNARVNTAGAYVCINDLYLFAIGTQLHQGCIPVIRLGGHREEEETAWQCAVRELREEANLQIRLSMPKTTYLANGDHVEAELQKIHWERSNDQECNPLLVVAYQREGKTLLSLMYLAQADGFPSPCSEIKGLLLLDEGNVHRLCQESLTLEAYLSSGGKALLTGEFDPKLVLEPFIQLRLLSRILKIRSKNQSLAECS